MNHPNVICNLCLEIIELRPERIKKQMRLTGGVSLCDVLLKIEDTMPVFKVGRLPEANQHLCAICIRKLKPALADIDPDKL